MLDIKLFALLQNQVQGTSQFLLKKHLKLNYKYVPRYIDYVIDEKLVAQQFFNKLGHLFKNNYQK